MRKFEKLKIENAGFWLFVVYTTVTAALKTLACATPDAEKKSKSHFTQIVWLIFKSLSLKFCKKPKRFAEKWHFLTKPNLT